MDLGLANQVVFIAGSTRGIGLSIAKALLAEDARIVLTGRDEESLQRANSELEGHARTVDQVLPIPGDFTDAATIDAAFEQTMDHFGRIDHLIANLGTGSGKPGWEQTGEEWDRLFNLNFFGSVRLTQAAMPHLLKNERGGSILYISSIVAVEATPAPLPYSAAKAALVNYSKTSRAKWARKIRVNTIAPGNIYFEGGSWERHLTNRREQVEQMLETEVPQKRFGKPEEIAALATWLCSPQANFTTGACFVVDGGQTRSV